MIACVAAGFSTIVGTGSAGAAPPLSVSTVATGLSIPWDLAVAPDGTILTGERTGRFVAVRPSGAATTVRADQSRIFATKEAGLMGLALDPRFAQTRRVYTCQAETTGGPAPAIPPDVANLPLPWPNTGQVINVVAWRVAGDWSRMNREGTVLTGIPVNSSGRHAGCALTAAPNGTLWVGTGDNAIPGNPQDRNSLGGKVLHINANGTPAAGNPIAGSPIYTLGHRNVQGVALRGGRVYVSEQGTDRDDELNLLRAGANYGYRPDRAPFIYDESVPMTDPQRVPGAVGALWTSGYPTIATTGIATLPAGWGEYSNGLVISALKGKRLVFVALNGSGDRVLRTSTALPDRYGRLRGLAVDRDGSLLVTTSNGSGQDRILRVRPTR
ncbi:PQQ-dependent sugar dehydrogenase [Gordonia sp. CPCC 205515]